MSIINKILENKGSSINDKILKELNRILKKYLEMDVNICIDYIKKTIDLSLYDEYELYIDYLGKSGEEYIGTVADLPIEDLYYLKTFKIETFKLEVVKEVLGDRSIEEGFIIDLSELMLLKYDNQNIISILV